MDHQTRAITRTRNFFSDSLMAVFTLEILKLQLHEKLLKGLFRSAGLAGSTRLSNLLTDLLAKVTYPRPLVDLGRLDPPDLSRHLTDLVFIYPLDGQKDLLFDIHGHAFREFHHNGMGETQGHIEFSLLY